MAKTDVPYFADATVNVCHFIDFQPFFLQHEIILATLSFICGYNHMHITHLCHRAILFSLFPLFNRHSCVFYASYLVVVYALGYSFVVSF